MKKLSQLIILSLLVLSCENNSTDPGSNDPELTKEELQQLLGRARAKKGMFEGDLIEGELEIGQISGLIKTIKPAAEIVKEIVDEFESVQSQLHQY